MADVATGAALTGAEVILPELRLHARADGTGFATIPDVARGRHRVRVRFLGYAPADLEILFQGDTTEVVFNLEMRPRTLDTVVVSQKRLDVVAPFADAVSMRYRMGIGRFLAGAQLAREENRDIDILLTTHFPDLSTVPGPMPQSPTIVSRSGVASGFYTGKCPVRIFLDDWPLPDNDLCANLGPGGHRVRHGRECAGAVPDRACSVRRPAALVETMMAM